MTEELNDNQIPDVAEEFSDIERMSRLFNYTDSRWVLVDYGNTLKADADWFMVNEDNMQLKVGGMVAEAIMVEMVYTQDEVQRAHERIAEIEARHISADDKDALEAQQAAKKEQEKRIKLLTEKFNAYAKVRPVEEVLKLAINRIFALRNCDDGLPFRDAFPSLTVKRFGELDANTRYLRTAAGLYDLWEQQYADYGVVLDNPGLKCLPMDMTIPQDLDDWDDNHPLLDKLLMFLHPDSNTLITNPENKHICSSEHSCRDYLLDALATSLSGSPNRTILTMQGATAGGKTTIASILKATLGSDYVSTLNSDAFFNSNSDSTSKPNGELLALTGGTRLAVISEPSKPNALNTELLKNLSGDDTQIQIRRMHKEFSPHTITATMLFATNKPLNSKQDTAFRAREVPLPIPQVPENYRDVSLVEKFSANPAARHALLKQLLMRFKNAMYPLEYAPHICAVERPEVTECIAKLRKDNAQDEAGAIGDWLVNNITPDIKAQGLQSKQIIDKLKEAGVAQNLTQKKLAAYMGDIFAEHSCITISRIQINGKRLRGYTGCSFS